VPSRIPPLRSAATGLALILALGFGLRLRAADHPYISQWDEAYHALVAKNLTAHPLTPTLYEEKVLPADDREWTQAGVWLHKPPLPLWLMAAGLAANLTFNPLDTVTTVTVQIVTLLLFLTFYIPCVSTFAVMLKTIGRRDALISVALSVGVALLVSGIVRFGLVGAQLLSG